MPNLWYPGAVHRPVPEASTQGFIKPRLALIHTNAATGHTASLYGWILNPASNGMECHFQVSLAGVIEQYMPVNRRADCNYRVNSFVVEGVTYGAISFETEDLGAATVDVTPLTAAQFEAIAKCLAWLNAEWGLSLATPTVWNGEGVGYHTQFPQHWTNVPGKTCPGAAKKAQLPSLRARAVVLAGIVQPPPPPPEEDLKLVRFQCIDADAAFFGWGVVTSAGAIVQTVQWCDQEADRIYRPHFDNPAVGHREATYKWGLQNLTFEGNLDRLNAAETLTTWVETDFRLYVPAN